MASINDKFIKTSVVEPTSKKKLIAVRFAEETQKDLEVIAEKVGLSVNATVIFLTHLAINEIKKGDRQLISKDIFIDNPLEN